MTMVGPPWKKNHLRQYVNTRDRITQTLSSEASASELDEEVGDSDSTRNSEKYTPSKRPKRQAFNRARRKIRRTVNKLIPKTLKKKAVGQKAKKAVVNVEEKFKCQWFKEQKFGIRNQQKVQPRN